MKYVRKPVLPETKVSQVAKVQMIEKFLHDNKVKHHRTGSRVIGGDTDESDWDICAYFPHPPAVGAVGLPELEMAIGYYFGTGGSITDIEGSDVVSWKTTDERINLIAVHDEKKYSRWVTATKVAKALELTEKPHRVTMFESIGTKGEVPDGDCSF